MTVELNRDKVFSIDNLPQVEIEVRNGRIAFIHSDCIDQVCVNTGFIGEHNQFAACLPNHIALRIDGNEKDNDNIPDTIVR